LWFSEYAPFCIDIVGYENRRIETVGKLWGNIKVFPLRGFVFVDIPYHDMSAYTRLKMNCIRLGPGTEGVLGN